MDDADAPASLEITDAETRQLLGLFDVPAFARRGQDLEYTLARLHERCARERFAMLEMVRVRLRQWAHASPGPDAWPLAFVAPIADLWPFGGAEAPVWAVRPAPDRRRKSLARDLVASVERFNRRWRRFLADLDLQPINARIDHYNHYYLLEKECVLGSARLAARHFIPRSRLSFEDLLTRYPLLLVPVLKS